MNRKVIRMTENDLHNIVKESVGKILREGYGTPPMQDIDRQRNAYLGRDSKDSLYDNSIPELTAAYMREFILGIDKIHRAAEWFSINYENEKPSSLKKYADMAYKKSIEIEDIYQQMRRILTMNLGLQPDTRYDLKHLSMDASHKESYKDLEQPQHHKVKYKEIPKEYMAYDQDDINKHIKRNKDAGKGRTFTSP